MNGNDTNSSDIEMEDVDEEAIVTLPKIISQQMNEHMENMEMSDDEDDGEIPIITPLKNQTKISDFIQQSNDGDVTPKTKTSSTPINVMQDKLQQA